MKSAGTHIEQINLSEIFRRLKLTSGAGNEKNDKVSKHLLITVVKIL